MHKSKPFTNNYSYSCEETKIIPVFTDISTMTYRSNRKRYIAELQCDTFEVL